METIKNDLNLSSFEHLPKHYQKALIKFFHFEVLVWDVCGDGAFMPFPSTEHEWSRLISLVSKTLEETQFHFGDVCLDKIKSICTAHAECVRKHKSFDDYHKDFRSTSPIRHSEKDRWPVIINSICLRTLFYDGWNRFHSYIAAGHKTIPIVTID
ncbi:hypothetical protein [Vibrio sp. D431a]|uniref:hypothetical protein n=1 Tax=Vibrio sp. D431a TaxID=2837388 RepID=UPI002556B502|nr:hypothetical protein [Vibrio sp. D431a]MDK9790137.1 hypothetical protein [Vibrio sp. D431a]